MKEAKQKGIFDVGVLSLSGSSVREVASRLIHVEKATGALLDPGWALARVLEPPCAGWTTIVHMKHICLRLKPTATDDAQHACTLAAQTACVCYVVLLESGLTLDCAERLATCFPVLA